MEILGIANWTKRNYLSLGFTTTMIGTHCQCHTTLFRRVGYLQYDQISNKMQSKFFKSSPNSFH